MSMFKWDVVDPAPGEAVAPHQRLAWGKTVGLGAQHVVAMFGATFVFPIVMGLDPNLAIMFSGICTILFLLIVQNKVPSYLGHQRLVRRRRGRDPRRRAATPADVTGAILVAGVVLAVGRRAGPLRRRRTDPQGPAAGGHRRGRHADRLQPGAGRGRHLLAAGPVGGAAHRPPFMVIAAVLLPGFWARIAVFLGADLRLPALVALRRIVFGTINSVARRLAPTATEHDRLGSPGPASGGRLVGFPSGTSPTGSASCTARASR